MSHQNVVMDFEQRLQKAIERGQRTSSRKEQAQAQHALNVEELKNLHSKYRLELSDNIELGLTKLAEHLLGFRYSPVMSEDGWGAVVSRDDLAGAGRGRPKGFYSRLEMLVRPFSSVHILELTAKATIRNKELFHRSHFQPIQEAELDGFREKIDLWIIEFAELYSAQD